MAIGIVCEFNPFHNGHEYLLKKAREIDPSGVVCAMSGGFVQRGEPSCADKYERASWATACGADVVVENPYPFSASSAEIFAKSAVRLLFGTGLCDSLCFGTENDDSEKFILAARFLADKKHIDGIKKLVSDTKKLGYAQAREIYVGEMMGEEYARFISTPNNILGVEYVRAMIYYGIPVNIHPIKRILAEHDGVPCGNIASASYIRSCFESDVIKSFCPDCVSSDKIYTTDNEAFINALRAKLLLCNKSELCETAEMTDDFAARLIKCAYTSSDSREFITSLGARHITDAKLRRMLTFAFIGTKKSELLQGPLYANLLSCTSYGASLVKSVRDSSDIPILSKISDSKNLEPSAKEQFDRAQLAEKVMSIFRTVFFQNVDF